MKIKSVTPDYTGGNIYVYLGELDNGQYFIAEDLMYDVTIVDADPRKAGDDAFQPDWIEEHLVRYLEEDNITFFRDMLCWVIDNKPDGNYNIVDMEHELMELDFIN